MKRQIQRSTRLEIHWFITEGYVSRKAFVSLDKEDLLLEEKF